VGECGYGDAAAIKTRLRNRLAEQFRVTPAAMRNRLIEGPCDILDQLRNSIQSRSAVLLPADWTVTATPPLSQQTFIEQPDP